MKKLFAKLPYDIRWTLRTGKFLKLIRCYFTKHSPQIREKSPNGNHEQIPFHIYCSDCTIFLGYNYQHSTDGNYAFRYTYPKEI